MKANTAKVIMKNGIERFEKVEGARASQQMMRYNSGACRYEVECAIRVLRRTSKAMLDATSAQLRDLVMASSAANAVLTADFVLGDAVSAWLPTSVNNVVNVPFEMNLLRAMNDFDHAVAALKPYL